jgi:hypothetical protein
MTETENIAMPTIEEKRAQRRKIAHLTPSERARHHQEQHKKRYPVRYKENRASWMKENQEKINARRLDKYKADSVLGQTYYQRNCERLKAESRAKYAAKKLATVSHNST